MTGQTVTGLWQPRNVRVKALEFEIDLPPVLRQAVKDSKSIKRRIELWALWRRQFTKEFQMAAVRRLEQGRSIAEVSRAFEVNPGALHRWRREFRHGPGKAFPGNGKPRRSDGRIAVLAMANGYPGSNGSSGTWPP